MKIKIKIYKLLGDCHIKMAVYSKALNYYLKMINLAWLLKDHDKEILAYDKLAVTYYYLGDISLSRVLHERMVNAKIEDDDSEAKV